MSKTEDYLVHVDRLMKRVTRISEKLIERNTDYQSMFQILSDAYKFDKSTVDTINHKMKMIMNCYQEMIEVLEEIGIANIDLAENVVEETENLRDRVNEYIDSSKVAI